MNAPAWAVFGAVFAFILSWQPQIESFIDQQLRGSMYSRLVTIAKHAKSSGFEAFKQNKTYLAHLYYGQAIVIYTVLSKEGHTEARFELGKLTCVGFGTERNQALAKHYFDQADLQPSHKERLYKIRELRACFEHKS